MEAGTPLPGELTIADSALELNSQEAPSGGAGPGGAEERPLPRSKLCLSADQHVLLGLRFQELSWDHTSPEEEESVLWLEFDGNNEGTPVNKLLKIYSKQVVGVKGH